MRNFVCGLLANLTHVSLFRGREVDSDIWSDFMRAHQTVVPTFVVDYFLIRRYGTATACSPDFGLSITSIHTNTTNAILLTVRAALTSFAAQLIKRKLVREAK